MSKGHYRKPWYILAARVTLIACVSLVLWACAVAAPFAAAHLASLHGTADRVAAAAALGGAPLGLLIFLCYLMNRV